MVGTDSALSEAAGSSRTVQCGVIVIGRFQPSCSHVTETTDNEFQGEVIAALREYTATITYSIVYGGYGSIRQGDTEADVRSIAAPGAGEGDFSYCHLIGVPDVYDGGYTTGYLIDRRVDSVLGVDPPATATTATGLRVGATADQVRDAYRGNDFEWVFGVQGTTWILLVNAPGDRESAIGFAFDWPPTATPPPGEAVSSRISAGTRAFASGFELCSG